MHPTPNTAEAVVVTGAAGFIASNLCQALVARGCDVVGIDNLDPFYDPRAKLANIRRIHCEFDRHHAANVKPASEQPSPTAFAFVEADIRDEQRMRQILSDARPATVFHFAALAGVRPSIEEPSRYVSVNVDGLVSVLDAARSVSCRNVVFASSSSVYGNNKKVPFAETDPVDEPISPYAATKRAGELICHTYSHLFNMRIAALRLFTVYGPAQRPDLAIGKFMRLIAAGEEVPMFGDGGSSRDYTYIDDIISGVLAAHEVVSGEHAQVPSATGSAGGRFRIYNLGNSHPITLAEMIDSIANVVGKPARIKSLPMQPGDVERTWADLQRSERELMYRPATSFLNGLQKQWEWISSAGRDAQPANMAF